MSSAPYKLFVYGSLRSGFRNPAYNYLTQYFKLLGDAVVKGQFFDKGDYPVAVPIEADHFINGELYEVNNPDEFSWAIEQLDDYENVKPDPGEVALYRRELVIAFQNGASVPAWIYWFNGSVVGLPSIETGDVLNYLQQKNKPSGAE